MPHTWNIAPEIPAQIRKQLAEYDDLTAQLLYRRGLLEPSEAEQFLHPSYESLHDPFLFMDMEKAVQRVWQAIGNKEKIFIYGDYDADAVTANAVLQQTFRYLGVEVESYIPDRFTEGYGLNLEAFDKIKNLGAQLVITVDCGTNSVDVAEYCKQNNLDLIITDHHEIIGPVPDALALINPKNPADQYPYHEITGVGVAYKLACGLLSKHSKVQERRDMLKKPFVAAWEKWLLDLVAIGTVADCHSLLGENRILVKFGLTVLTKTRWAGLKALCARANVDCSARMPDTYTIGFVIAPRLNAAGRLQHANIALHLLLEENPLQAAVRADQLEQINQNRQDITARILSEAREQIELIKDRKILIIMGEGWSKGVVGLVAGRLVEEYKKPVIVMEKNGETATGSARTIGEFNVVEALKHASEHLCRFGGHKQAAGLTLRAGEYEDFYRKMLEYAEEFLSEDDMRSKLELEAILDTRQLTLETAAAVAKFEPFGVDNTKPKFLVEGLSVRSVRLVGASQQHLQLQLQAGDRQIGAIVFNASDFAKNVNLGDTIDVAAELVADSWNGRQSVKLRVIDIRKR